MSASQKFEFLNIKIDRRLKKALKDRARGEDASLNEVVGKILRRSLGRSK